MSACTDSPGLAWLREAILGAAVALALTALFFLSLNPIAVTDFWWQARTGEVILRTGVIPDQDPFSWTARGQPWIVHEWMTEVFFYIALTRLGEGALVAYKAGLAVVACSLVLLRAWNRSGSATIAIAAAIACGLVMRHYADLRPQMVSFVLLAALFLALDEYRAGRLSWLPWSLPALFALWANLHGGVVVGAGVLVLWTVGELAPQLLRGRVDRPAVMLAAGTIAACIAAALNPNGFHVYWYPFQVLGYPGVMDYITEWFAPNFHRSNMRAFEAVLIGALVLPALARGTDVRSRRRGVPLSEILLLAATAHMALMSVRNTVLFTLVAAPLVAGALGWLWLDLRRKFGSRSLLGRPGVQVAHAALLACLVGAVAWWALPREKAADGRMVAIPPGRWYETGIRLDAFPVEAVAEMKRGRWPGKLYNDYIWGGYLIWELYPQRSVFVDGRAEVYYPSGAFRDEMFIHNTWIGWREALDRRGVDVVLTSRFEALAYALRKEPDWTLEFVGPVEAVFTRDRR